MVKSGPDAKRGQSPEPEPLSERAELTPIETAEGPFIYRDEETVVMRGLGPCCGMVAFSPSQRASVASHEAYPRYSAPSIDAFLDLVAEQFPDLAEVQITVRGIALCAENTDFALLDDEFFQSIAKTRDEELAEIRETRAMVEEKIRSYRRKDGKCEGFEPERVDISFRDSSESATLYADTATGQTQTTYSARAESGFVDYGDDIYLPPIDEEY